MLRALRTLADGNFYIRNAAKFAGFALGSLGTIILALFIVVVITGEPYSTRPSDPGTVVYPNL